MNRSRKFRRNRRFELYLHAARFTSNNDDPLRTALYLGTSAFHNPVAFVTRMVKNKGRL